MRDVLEKLELASVIVGIHHREEGRLADFAVLDLRTDRGLFVAAFRAGHPIQAQQRSRDGEWHTAEQKPVIPRGEFCHDPQEPDSEHDLSDLHTNRW